MPRRQPGPPQVNLAGQSHLWIAASLGDVAKVHSLLASEGGALLVNLQVKDGIAPMYAACMKGHVEVVHALLFAGAMVNLQAGNGLSPMHMACAVGDMEVVLPLHIVCTLGHIQAVHALLQAGAKVGLQASEGTLTPLHLACTFGHVEVVHALQAGAEVDQQASAGASSLHVACAVDRVEVVRALLSAGAEVDQQATEGVSPCTWHANMATRRWCMHCCLLGPSSTCRTMLVLHPCTRHARRAT